MMEVKGTAVATLPIFVKKNFGEEGLAQWLTAITPEARMIFEFKVKNNEWYPLKTALVEPVAVIAQLFFEWDLKKTGTQLGRFSAEYGLKGVYRFLLKIGKPQMFVEKGSQYMGSYYRPCRTRIAENSHGRGLVQIIEFPEMEKTIEYRIAGWIQRGLEMNGCRDVNVDVSKSLTRLDPFTEFVVTYK